MFHGRSKPRRTFICDAIRGVNLLEGALSTGDSDARLPFTESDLLVVKLPDNDQPLLTICKAMLGAEINIHYAYPLLIGVGAMGHTALAMHVEDHEAAMTTLSNQGFTIYTENDLEG